MGPLNTFIIGCGGSSGSHLLASMLHGLSGIRVGPEINLFHPHGLYDPKSFSLTLYQYLTRRGNMVAFEIPGVIHYGLVPNAILEHRAFYGLDSIAAEWKLLRNAENLESLVHLIKSMAAERHGWPKNFVWFEHTPRNALAAVDFLTYFTDSHFIHLVRDGRDAVFSQWRRFSARFKSLSDEQAWELAVTLWVLLDAHAQQVEAHPGYLKIYFEDLVRSPVYSVNRILAHVGLPTVSAAEFFTQRDISQPDFGGYTGVKDHTWQADPNKAIRQDVVGVWRRDAPTSLLDKFMHHPITIGNDKTFTLKERLTLQGYTD